jgi:hypothetical protein
MAYVDSAAARFLDLIRAFRGVDRRKSIREAWGIVLDAQDDPSFFRRYAFVLELFSDARSELMAAGGSNPEIFTRRLGKVEHLLKRGLAEPMTNAHSDLDEATMEALDLGAHRCLELAPTLDFEKSVLEDISTSATTLLERIAESALPSSLKASLTERLRALIDAVAEFRFFGLRNLKTQLEAAVGAVSIAAATDPQLKSKEEVRSMMEFLKNSLVVLSVVKAAGDVGKLLSDTLTNLIGS